MGRPPKMMLESCVNKGRVVSRWAQGGGREKRSRSGVTVWHIQEVVNSGLQEKC